MGPDSASENSKQPAPNKTKLSHEPPVLRHDSFPILPDLRAKGQVRLFFLRNLQDVVAFAVPPKCLNLPLRQWKDPEKSINLPWTICADGSERCVITLSWIR